ncbi:COMM domain-containing protein 8 [Nymphon striatum]|nr:COMM domain-containing protein 8 [Nymphon striatum]
MLFYEVVDYICRNHHPKYLDYKKLFSLEEWWDVTDALTYILKECAKNNYNCKDEINKCVSNVNEEALNILIEVLSVKKQDIHSALVSNSCNISDSNLKDFDWRMKFSLASDKFSRIREPLLNLDLFIDRNGAEQTLSLEMSKEEVKQLISSLEMANKVTFFKNFYFRVKEIVKS